MLVDGFEILLAFLWLDEFYIATLNSHISPSNVGLPKQHRIVNTVFIPTFPIKMRFEFSLGAVKNDNLSLLFLQISISSILVLLIFNLNSMPQNLIFLAVHSQ